METYSVRDGARTLKFHGELLSESSSQIPGRARWVEFKLYRTAGGQYVLSRIGVSHYIHSGACSIVRRNDIPSAYVKHLNLDENWTQCRECGGGPDEDGILYPEQPRYWAQASKSADGVIECLYKYDDNDTRYLTRVAERLLADAADRDDNIRNVYLSEEIE